MVWVYVGGGSLDNLLKKYELQENTHLVHLPIQYEIDIVDYTEQHNNTEAVLDNIWIS